MKQVTLRGKTYAIKQVNRGEWIQLAKYANAFSPDINYCLTPAIDKAAAYAITKIIPDIDLALANPDFGIFMDLDTEFTPLYKAIDSVFNASRNPEEATLDVDVSPVVDDQVLNSLTEDQLEKRLKELRGGE